MLTCGPCAPQTPAMKASAANHAANCGPHGPVSTGFKEQSLDPVSITKMTCGSSAPYAPFEQRPKTAATLNCGRCPAQGAVVAGPKATGPEQCLQLGANPTTTYLNAVRPMVQCSQLPTVAVPEVNKSEPCDSYPAPTPMTKSIKVLPWRPSAYYQTAKVNPCTRTALNVPGTSSCGNQPPKSDCVRVPPVFAAARNALYTRFTCNDWVASNQGSYMASDRVRSGAERLRLDTIRLCHERDEQTRRTQSDVGKRLGERLGDLNFWKTEVNHELDLMITESNALNEAKRILEKNLAESENPLHISQECLYNREKRQSIELVHDCPEKNLIQEVDLIKCCQERMRNTIDRANVQLGLNRASQHELERDSSDKFLAETLDSTCHLMRNTSRGLAYHDGVHRIDNTISVPETWAKYTNDNIQRSQCERVASKNMRLEIESIINTCNNNMWQQWNGTNTALNQRIQETTEARNKVQQHLSRTLQEIYEMERNIELLKKSIQDKVEPMQVAQTRLDTRLRRPNIEACRDPVQNRLVEEVHEITNTVDHLQHKLREAENALQALLRTKGALEQELSIKNNTLFIDRERCLAMRKTFPMAPRLVAVA